MKTNCTLADLVNIDELQKLADAYLPIMGMPLAIVDASEGTVLVSSGWQDICVRFHRRHPVTSQRCVESDCSVCARAAAEVACEYRCKNGLNDIGLPVFVEGRHLATVFLGQFFYDNEPPDREYFRRQAGECGFDEEEYLAALDRVPVFSRKRVTDIIDCMRRLTGFLAAEASMNLRLRREIAEREQAERALREQQILFRTTVDLLPLSVACIDSEGRYIFVNRSYENTFGKKAAYFEGKHYSEVLPAPIAASRKPWVERSLTGETVTFSEESFPNPAAPAPSCFLATYTPLPSIDGTVRGVVAAILDVTEQKKTEAAIRESEQRLRLHFEQNALGVIYWSPDLRVERWNRAAERIFGYTAAEAVGRQAGSLLPSDALSLIQPALDRPTPADVDGEPVTSTVITKDGRAIRCQWDNTPLTTADGQVFGVASLVQDVTDSEQARDFLLIQRDLGIALGAARNLSAAMTCIVDAACRIPEIDCAGIYLVDQTTQMIELACHRGIRPEFVAAVSRFSADTPEARMAAQNGPFFLDRSETAANPAYSAEGLRALAIIPIHHEGQAIAVVNLASHRCDDFPLSTRHALEALASRLGEVLNRIRAEDALAAKEQRLSLALSGAHIGTWDWDVATGRAIINEECNAMLGYSLGEIEPTIVAWERLVHPDDRARVYQSFAMPHGDQPASFSVEYRLRAKSGEWKWMLASGQVVSRDANGRPLRIAGVHLDITERRRAESALLESEATLRTITAAARDAIVMIDHEGKISFWNPGATQMLGWTAPEACGQDLHLLIASKASHDGYLRGLETFRQSGQGPVLGRTLELRARRKDGVELPVEISMSAVQLGGRWHAVGIMRDISERMRADAALRESEHKYRHIFESVQDVLYQLDAKGHIVEISPSVEHYSLYKRAELIGRHAEALYWEPADRQSFLAHLHAAGEVVDFELRVRDRQDRLIYTSVNARLLRDANGAPAGIEGTMRDITARKLAEAALSEKTEEIDRFFGLTPDLLGIVSPEGTAIRLNRAWDRTFGYPAGALTGKNVMNFTHPEDAPAMGAALDRLRRGEDLIDHVSRFRCHDGSHRWIEWRATLYQGRFLFVAGRDITERRLAETELQRLYEQTRHDAQTRSDLLKEVNHRVKNNLTAILGLLLNERQHALGEGQPAVAAVLDRLGQRLRGLLLVHQMLSASCWAPVPVADLAERVIRSALSAVPRDRRVALDIHAPAIVSPRQAANLALVLNELATNTIKYAVPGRTLTTVSIRTLLETGSLRLTYRDDGPGYPPDVLAGTSANVGLALVRQLVTETLRGRLVLANDSGAVATFHIKTEENRRT